MTKHFDIKFVPLLICTVLPNIEGTVKFVFHSLCFIRGVRIFIKQIKIVVNP